jgi:hypothetical protein
MQWWGHQLLDAIDSSLRRQYTLEGVYHWAFYRMVPPLLGAEVLVSCCVLCNKRVITLSILLAPDAAQTPG